MVDWEYKLVPVTFVTLTKSGGQKVLDDLEKTFNKLSKEGWELHTHNQMALCATLYVFRRKKK